MKNAGYTKKIYKLWAKCYDNFVDPLFKFNRQGAFDELRIKKNEHILEVGVGTGLNLPYYPPHCKVTGIDFSSSMLAKAKSKKCRSRVVLKIQDARKMEFDDNQFDKALATYVLRVSPEPKKILKEVSRVTKRNGLFVVVDQFKGKNRLILALFQPFKRVLGWGKEYRIKKLIANTPWETIKNLPHGKMSNTRLVVLKNAK